MRHQTIIIYILPNISRSKGNQTMKFDQLMEYNMRNIFIGKSYTKNVVEILNMFLNQWAKVSYSLHLFYASCGLSKYIETKRVITCFYLTWHLFKKKKKRSLDYPPCLTLCMIFEGTCFSYYLYHSTNFTVCLPLLREILNNMCIVTVC